MASSLPRRLAPSLLLLAAACGGEAPSGASPPLDGPFTPLPERLLHEPTGLVLVHVPAGRFTRGTPESEAGREGDETRYTVDVGAFWMTETEVTVGAWRRIAEEPYTGPREGDDLPATGVTWHAARAWIERLNAKGPGGWSLPTEAQWEYACRAGTTTPFSFGETIGTDQANFDGSRPYVPEGADPDSLRGWKSDGPVAVKSYPPNAWGLYDMHGNVFEWCDEPYLEDPLGPPPSGLTAGSPRVIRGGAFSSQGKKVRSGHRDGYPPNSSGQKYGFRLVFEPPR